jgi:hypothetical protein
VNRTKKSVYFILVVLRWQNFSAEIQSDGFRSENCDARHEKAEYGLLVEKNQQHCIFMLSWRLLTNGGLLDLC